MELAIFGIGLAIVFSIALLVLLSRVGTSLANLESAVSRLAADVAAIRHKDVPDVKLPLPFPAPRQSAAASADMAAEAPPPASVPPPPVPGTASWPALPPAYPAMSPASRPQKPGPATPKPPVPPMPEPGPAAPPMPEPCAAATVQPPGGPSRPAKPSKLGSWAAAAWDWLRVGEDWRPEWIPGEYAVAAVQLLRAAALLLLFGAAWTVRYIHEHDWFRPGWRVVAGFACAAALVVAGARLARNRWRPLGLAIAGIGFALGEFVDWAGANLYGVLPASAAIGIAAFLAIGAGAMAWGYSSLLLALVALVAGYSAPLFFPEGMAGGDAALLGWLLLPAAEAAVLAVARGWRCLPWVALAADIALWTPAWAPARLDALGRGWAVGATALRALFAWVQSLGHPLRRRNAPFWPDLAAWFAGTVSAAVFATGAAWAWPHPAHGLPELVLAGGCGALACAFLRRGIRDRATLECLAAGGSALLLAAICLSLDGTPRCVALSAAAVAAVWAAARWRSVPQAVFALAAWSLWLGFVGTPDTAAARAGRIGSAVASLWAAGLLLLRMETDGRKRFSPVALWVAWAASLAWGTWETRHAYSGYAPSLALYWSIHALATLVAGLRFGHRGVRFAALALFALAAAKFLLVDQAGAPTPERVAGFLGVGLLLLAGSAFYIRFARMRSADGPGRGKAQGEAAAK